MTTERAPRLFGRVVEVRVGGVTVSGLQVICDIEYPVRNSDVRASVDIYNLNENTRSLIARGQNIEVTAGYESLTGVVLEGTVAHVTHPRLRSVIISRIQAMGKVPATALTNRSWANEALENVVRAIVVEDMGLQLSSDALRVLRNLPGRFGTWSFSGPSRWALTQLLEPYNVSWFEDAGLVDVLVSTAAGIRVPVLATGIITEVSLPEVLNSGPSDEGPRVTTLLLPTVRKGSLVNVQHDSLRGVRKVIGLRHRINNRENLFVSEMTLGEVTI